MKLLTVLAIVCLLALAATPADAHRPVHCHTTIGGLTYNGHHIRARYRICWIGRPYTNGSERTVTVSTPAGSMPFETLRWPL